MFEAIVHAPAKRPGVELASPHRRTARSWSDTAHAQPGPLSSASRGPAAQTPTATDCQPPVERLGLPVDLVINDAAPRRYSGWLCRPRDPGLGPTATNTTTAAVYDGGIRGPSARSTSCRQQAARSRRCYARRAPREGLCNRRARRTREGKGRRATRGSVRMVPSPAGRCSSTAPANTSTRRTRTASRKVAVGNLEMTAGPRTEPEQLHP
jgi:hypothetical protein